MIKLRNLILENKGRYYSGILLDTESRETLLRKFKIREEDGWVPVAHHMTIDPFGSDVDERIGQEVILTVIEYGFSDKAIAVKVSGYDRKTNNAFPHVTLAYNELNGGLPKDSNKITHWEPIKVPFKIKGTIENINSTQI